MLQLGIVGLPNVGKSTLFNALTSAKAEAANYPFCTVDPNVGMVEVPDARLAKLAEIVQPKRTLPAAVQFVDIAGLVKGASQGEGLGNKFLQNIRETDAIVHVIRCFADDDVTHVMGSPDPARDKETIELELALADLAVVEKRLDKVKRAAKAHGLPPGRLMLPLRLAATGLDVGAAAQIRAEILALRDAGCAVLVVSEELEELFEISDRLHVIAKGRLSPSLPRAEATVERIGEWMSGLWPAQSGMAQGVQHAQA